MLEAIILPVLFDVFLDNLTPLFHLLEAYCVDWHGKMNA